MKTVLYMCVVAGLLASCAGVRLTHPVVYTDAEGVDICVGRTTVSALALEVKANGDTAINVWEGRFLPLAPLSIHQHATIPTLAVVRK